MTNLTLYHVAVEMPYDVVRPFLSLSWLPAVRDVQLCECVPGALPNRSIYCEPFATYFLTASRREAQHIADALRDQGFRTNW